ncbi:MAG: hypothetical protein J1E02_08840, partial [Coprobacter sp.]|nr:hypothetical protein [Coprobacter sp.]
MKRAIWVLTVLWMTVVSGMYAASPDYKAAAFTLYLNGDMAQWTEIIDKISALPEWKSDDRQLEILTYYYGLVGHLLDKKRKDDAERELTKAMNLADRLYKKMPDNALLLGLMANFTGFQIALSPLKATTLAKGMLSKAKQSVALAPDDPYVNILYSNILFYMPSVFGGSKEKALAGYRKARQYMESHAGYTQDNWMYVQLLASIGLVEEKNENYAAARQIYQKILRMYPE